MSDRKENAKTPAGAPVMKAASSLVRNDTVPTRSAGTSGRLIACMEAAWRYSSSMLAMPARGARALIVLAATMWAAPPRMLRTIRLCRSPPKRFTGLNI